MHNEIVTKDNKEKQTTTKKEIIKTWLTGNRSCTLIVPIELARACRMDEPCHVVVERLEDGILIRKLEV